MLLDIPKDPERSFVILKLAEKKTEDKEELKNLTFYFDYLKKLTARII